MEGGTGMSGEFTNRHTGELVQLKDLSARIGGDPLLTQASTGNTSIKLDDVLWIKASGRWLADAKHEDILVPLDLREVKRYISQQVDPAEVYACASIETAMHAVLPHPVVLHVHSVNTIAWAVRHDARQQLQRQLDGLRWQWVPYVPSGLPLAQEIERAVSASVNTNVLVLGNHGLVIAGDSCEHVTHLLSQVERRLALRPRTANPPDYHALDEVSEGSSWALPEDDGIHALAIDLASQAILSGGILFPCQSIFSNWTSREMFQAVPWPFSIDQCESLYGTRSFLMIAGRGVIVKKTMTPSQRAMMSGLAQVVQRINSAAPIHYLSDEEVEYSRTMATRYLEKADAVPMDSSVA
jgi:rhamnose utilization protein RhaD (predicted bifunctional aldolase and dehydrogenase)